MAKVKPDTPGPLMLGLYYPAALGAALVQIIRHAHAVGFEAFGDIRFYWAVLLIIYFSHSWLSSRQLPTLGWREFAGDLAEVALLTYCFIALGFFESRLPSTMESWRPLFAALTVVPALHLLWNLQRHPRLPEVKKVRPILVARAAISIVGLIWGDADCCIPVVALILFGWLSLWYGAIRDWRQRS